MCAPCGAIPLPVQQVPHHLGGGDGGPFHQLLVSEGDDGVIDNCQPVVGVAPNPGHGAAWLTKGLVVRTVDETPNSSISIASCTLHEVQDPHSAVAWTITSQRLARSSSAERSAGH